MIAPLDDGNLVLIVIAIYGENEDEHSTSPEEQTEVEHEAFGRIISARRADKEEQVLYLASRTEDWF